MKASLYLETCRAAIELLREAYPDAESKLIVNLGK